MSYLEEQCNAVIRVINHAADLKAHRLAGYAANIDFWAGEIRHCLDNLDGYYERFRRMKEATEAYVAEHGGPSELDSDARVTKGIKDHQRKELRESLCFSAERLLKRCYKAGLIDAAKLREVSEQLGIEVPT